MSRRLKLHSAAALSAYTSLMLAAFILMHALGTETPGFAPAVYVLIGAAAMVLSAAVTLLTVRAGMYDDYQMRCVERVRAVTRTASLVLTPIIAIAAVALDSLGFALCVGMLANWLLLFADAASAAVIGNRR